MPSLLRGKYKHIESDSDNFRHEIWMLSFNRNLFFILINHCYDNLLIDDNIFVLNNIDLSLKKKIWLKDYISQDKRDC